jgi:pantetheine-phosphate adenylyltransferase
VSKVAVYPGSFDPITLGHVDIIQRLSLVFDKVIVLVAKSSVKSGLFTPEERKSLIEQTLKGFKNVEVDIFEGLTVEYLKKVKAQVIVRGLRAVVDFEYEMTMACMNKKLEPQFETMLMFAAPEYYYISSRGVKEVAANGGSLKGLVPDLVAAPLKMKINSAPAGALS